jgi:hypothetical protein
LTKAFFSVNSSLCTAKVPNSSPPSSEAALEHSSRKLPVREDSFHSFLDVAARGFRAFVPMFLHLAIPFCLFVFSLDGFALLGVGIGSFY